MAYDKILLYGDYVKIHICATQFSNCVANLIQLIPSNENLAQAATFDQLLKSGILIHSLAIMYINLTSSHIEQLLNCGAQALKYYLAYKIERQKQHKVIDVPNRSANQQISLKFCFRKLHSRLNINYKFVKQASLTVISKFNCLISNVASCFQSLQFIQKYQLNQNTIQITILKVNSLYSIDRSLKHALQQPWYQLIRNFINLMG